MVLENVSRETFINFNKNNLSLNLSYFFTLASICRLKTYL